MISALVKADALALPLRDETVDLVVTSPPYFGLRDYATDEAKGHEVGGEEDPAAYVDNLVAATSEMARVLRPAGSIFVNLGDKYDGRAGGPQGKSSQRTNRSNTAGQHREGERAARPAGFGSPKSLLGLPWRYALRCMDDLGLTLRAEIIWAKPNGMPESVTDRVARKHEQWFHFTLGPDYYSAVDEIREEHAPQSVARSGRNRFAEDRSQDGVGSPHSARPEDSCNVGGKLPGSVWEIATQPLSPPAWVGEDHYAAFPIEWPRRIILGWSPPGYCVACGEARFPITEKRGQGKARTDSGDGGRGRSTLPGYNDIDRSEWAEQVEYRITGYGCACPTAEAPTRPAVVLDPFGGTGTTAAVARALGRTGISLDLSARYHQIARWRCSDPELSGRVMDRTNRERQGTLL